MYTVSTKEPPLPQMWIETRREYLHNHMQWYAKYEEKCISLAKHMVSRLPSSDSHLSVWKEIIKMSSSPMIQVERSFLAEFLEFLELFIIPALEYSQSSNKDMGFPPGYMASLWPYTMRQQILTLMSFQEYPDRFFPKTCQQKFNSLKEQQHFEFFAKNI